MESQEMEISMEPLSGGFMRVSLRREGMDLQEWIAMVESWARNLASRMGGESRVNWHGHAEVFIMPPEGMYLQKEDEETGEILETPVNPWLRLWVD